jgi:hypothetical protein
MSEFVEAVEGIIALVAGGFVLILIGSAAEASSNPLDVGTVGILMILLGVVLAIAIVAALIGQILSALGGGR